MSTAAFRAARVIAAAVICIATASSCDDGLPTGPVSVADCAAGSGATHRGRLSGSPTWTRQNGPHRLVDSVTTAGTITIEAGALVCGTPGSVLAPALLRVEGSVDRPVVFTATDSLVGWGGIRGGEGSDSSSVIRYAVIRHAELGVSQTNAFGANVVVENTTISRSRGPALAGGITARNVVLDSACAAAAEGTCAAVGAGSYRLVTLVEPVIRDSRGGGIFVAERGGVDLTGGTITGSRGVGIAEQYSVRGSGLLILRSPVQITGGATIPLRLADGLPPLLEEREAQLQLLGNATDELHVHGPLSNRERTVFRELPWTLSPSCEYPGFIGTIRLEAGASITIDARCDALGEIVGAGTPSDPVTIHGNGVRIRSFMDSVASPIRLSHAHVTGAHLIFDATPAVLEDVELDGGSIRFEAAGSRLTRAHIHGSGEDGIVVAADDVVITDCTIEDNARHGVHVESGEPRIERCNLRGNGGAGVSNSGTGIVDARDNWWGAASGPQGPGGDGIAGAVLYEPFRTEMVVW